MNFFGPRDIKVHIRKTLESLKNKIENKKALDFPCGNGETLTTLQTMGATPVGGDIFPELSKVDCLVKEANLCDPFPFENEEFDFAVCQEGIEHVGPQNFVFDEFNRVLKPGGTLIMTTPNYSKIKSRLSYLFTESEAFGRIMPPNEVDSIWLNDDESTRVYYGHVFLTGFLRLRLFANLAGFKIKEIHPTKVNFSSLLWFPVVYPFVLFFSYKTYRRFLRKTGKKALGKEVLSYMISPKILLENHLLLEFEKVEDVPSAIQRIQGKGDFSMTT